MDVDCLSMTEKSTRVSLSYQPTGFIVEVCWSVWLAVPQKSVTLTRYRAPQTRFDGMQLPPIPRQDVIIVRLPRHQLQRFIVCK